MTHTKRTDKVDEDALAKLYRAAQDNGYAVTGCERKEQLGRPAVVVLYLKQKGFGANVPQRESDF